MEGKKRWIRLISIKKSKKSYNTISSFEELENQFYSHKKLVPTFRCRSKNNIVIKRIEDFLENDENSFVVTYFADFLENPSKFPSNSKNLKLRIVQKDLYYDYMNMKIQSLREKIENIKIMIEKNKGIDKTKQLLIFNGKQLDNEKSSLLDNFIENNNILTLRIIPEERLKFDKKLGLDFFLEKKISIDGGKIHSSMIDLEVSAGSVIKETYFSIKRTNDDFDYPFGINKLSSLFELNPHSMKFNKPVIIRFKNYDFWHDDDVIYLFKQEDNKTDRILKKWTIYHPKKREENFIEFELDCFSFAFLGRLVDKIMPGNTIELNNSEFRNKFQDYQVIHPGLNYQIVCENNKCPGYIKLMIFKKGYGIFRPNEDINQEMICHFCSEQIRSIKSVILLQAEGKIEFRLNNTKDNVEDTFKAKGSELIIFGDEESYEEFDKIVITVAKSCKPHKNIIAGITCDDLNSKISKNVDKEIVTYIIPNSNFDYKEFNSTNADFKLNNMEVTIPFIKKKLTPVYEYIEPQVTDKMNISLMFKLSDSDQNIEPLVGLLGSTTLCLFGQEKDELDETLNKWNVSFPDQFDERQNCVKFEIKYFNKAFLGVIDYEIKNNENKLKFPRGLTYYVSCEENSCIGIINRGYGTFYPSVDIQHTLKCPSCDQTFNSIRCIQTVILNQVIGTVTFKLTGENAEKKKSISTKEKRLIIIGESLERFDEFIIETKPSIN